MTNNQAEPVDPAPPQRGEREQRREPAVIDADVLSDRSGAESPATSEPTVEASAEPAAPAAPRKSRTGLVVSVIALVVALGGAGGAAYWFDYLPDFLSGETQPAPVAKTPTPTPSPAPLSAPAAKPPAVAPSGPSASAPAPQARPTPTASPSAPVAPPPASPKPVAEIQPKPAASDVSAALEGRLARIEAALQNRPAPPPPTDLKPLESRLASLDQRLKAIEDQLSAPKTEVRAAEAPAAVTPRGADPAALAVIAEAMSRAIDAGAAFPLAVSAAQAMGAPADLLAPLKAVAEKGAPPAAALAKRFAAEEKAILAAAEPPPPADASLVDRLTLAARKLVRVRPAGEAAGDDPPALVSRIEAALARGATGDALTAWNLLPEPAKAASRGFADEARARAGAQAAAAALSARAIEAIVNSKDKP